MKSPPSLKIVRYVPQYVQSYGAALKFFKPALFVRANKISWRNWKIWRCWIWRLQGIYREYFVLLSKIDIFNNLWLYLCGDFLVNFMKILDFILCFRKMIAENKVHNLRKNCVDYVWLCVIYVSQDTATRMLQDLTRMNILESYGAALKFFKPALFCAG